MIKWDDKYLLGIDIIDEQHKELFRIAQEASDLLEDDFTIDKYDKVINIIEELKSYAVYHFKAEEEFMLDNEYRKYLSHKIIHDEFLEKVSKVDLEAMDENQNEHLLSIINFVVDWIATHILGTDKLIAETLKGAN